MRFMAAEPRLRRRSLAEALLEAIKTTSADQRRLQVIPRQLGNEPMYVFLLLPWRDDKPEDENRDVRRGLLEACLYVARMKYPNAPDVIGIATESGTDRSRRSEDALYFDTRAWSDDDEERAREYQRDLEILVGEESFTKHVDEYPVDRAQSAPLTIPKNPRNKPCPCGSGRKYKQCHGA